MSLGQAVIPQLEKCGVILVFYSCIKVNTTNCSHNASRISGNSPSTSQVSIMLSDFILTFLY